MSFELSEVVPWGRSYDEYVAMFALDEADLGKSILGCADGPASFNASLTKRGGSVVSLDPLYRWSGAEIRDRIRHVMPTMLEQTRANAQTFVWDRIGSIDELARIRLAAMDEFLADYEAGDRTRYVTGTLPTLPFADGHFDLALCSHFLLLYSEHHSLAFHVDAVVELCRVADEVRVFPLLELAGCESRHLAGLMSALEHRRLDVRRQRVPYEFRRGANQMLRIRRCL